MAVAPATAEGVQRSIVERVLEQAELPLEQALPLPGEAYESPAFYAIEREAFLERDWICIGRADQVPNTGDYLAVDLFEEPLILVRDEQSTVRVFSRVCRHRYEDLLGGQTPEHERVRGCARRFECPYHAWTYRLDGSLLSAPEMAGRPGFELGDFPLQEINTAHWQGFVFINFADDPEPLDMSPLEPVLDAYDFTDWRVVDTLEWGDTRVNWKIVVENFLEAYHHIGIHKNVLQPLWPLGAVERGEYLGPEWYTARMFAGPEFATGEEDGYLQMPMWLPPAPGLSAYQRSHTLLLARFPMFLLAPGPDLAFWFRLFPTGPETHDLQIHILAPNSSLAAPEFEEGVAKVMEFITEVQGQDASVNERVQSSAKSRHARGGVLALHEQPLWNLQKYLHKMLSAVVEEQR